MLAELAAANAAFGVIKSFVSNGKELASCGKQISDFVFAKEKIEKEVNKQKAMIYVGRPGLWADWQKFQAQARKARREQERLAQKKREEIMTVVQWVVGVSLAFTGFVAVVYLAAKWAGKI